MNSLLQQFNDHIRQLSLWNKEEKLLLAVSGGRDSVVLSHLLFTSGYDFTIAHCNFQLRGAESDRDEQFVRQLAADYAASFLLKRFDTKKYCHQNQVSAQVAARELRYDWFYSLLEEDTNIKAILTAHHAGDNTETLLMNFFKGTGIAGLRAILPQQGRLIRPLLFASPEEINMYAIENGLKWVEDSSNATDNYTRNLFRNKIIPQIQQVYPQVMNNLRENTKRFRDIELLYQQAIDQHKKKLLVTKGEETHIPVLKLIRSQPLHTIVYEIIKDFGFSPHQVSAVIHLTNSETGHYVDSASHRILRNRNWLMILPLQSETIAQRVIETGDTMIKIPGGTLELKIQEHNGQSLLVPPHTGLLDAGKISFPLLLRPWKQGDYFYPLGMKKKKKVARFLIDQKIPRTEKDKILVLEMNKRIVWVVGHRIDDRFKITTQTKSLLRVSLGSI